MSQVKWTKEQQLAIEEKNSNILVAAAAGSGKTAVLVERIIHKVLNEKIDIDKILVVTFTNAAASEMRQRILEAIYQKLEEEPENIHLQKQTVLLSKANICTIHSFCLDVIRNNFFEIDASANFTIADPTEVTLLKQEVLEEVFEDKYEKQEEEFLKLIHSYTSYRGDDSLKELILDIYNYIQSNPFPEEWLQEKIEMFNREGNLEKDFSQTIWGEILLQDFKETVQECLLDSKDIVAMLEKYPELIKFSKVIANDIMKLEEIQKVSNKWDETYEASRVLAFDRWPQDKKIEIECKEIAKEKRDNIKKKFTQKRDKYLLYNSKQANEDIGQMYPMLQLIEKIVIEFSLAFQAKKKEKNKIDFSDIEHLALKILVQKNEEGHTIKTQVAKKYEEKFAEIAIDEYQDSNLVQEYILSMVSNGKNIFMVGDVKQSIYRFRQARPELFLTKYESYKTIEERKTEEPLKIQLFKNFRSRENILKVTNSVFHAIMSKKMGDIEYTKQEFLNLGADYKKPEGNKTLYAGKAQIHIIDLKEVETEEEDSEEIIEKTTIEARFVANQMEELLNSGYQVYDKGNYRPITYKDIVILLRATSLQAPIYEKELLAKELPVFSDAGGEYLDSIEIETIISFLKIIDNPMQDIPLVTVLRSAIGGFTDNELISIRINDTKVSYYESMLHAKEKVAKLLWEKIQKFLEKLQQYREEQEDLTLEELIWKIYMDTGYFNYVELMPNGAIRQANLKMLLEKAKQYERASFKGIFNFIHFIDKLKTSSGDTGSAKLIGENENVIRIMSIHKSKGLEFPVVFLCGTGKQFNLRDLNQNILMHQELGIGPNYIDYERRLEYSTLAKEAIKVKSKMESLSEEERILYVALTRSKEKLIITGVSSDYEKAITQKQNLLERQCTIDNQVDISILKTGKSYLDWLEFVYLLQQDNIKEELEMVVHSKLEVLKQAEEKKQDKKVDILAKLEEYKNQTMPVEAITQKLNWTYPYRIAAEIPTKTSVTQLKQKNIPIQQEDKNIKQITDKPEYLREQKEQLSSAQKGTIVHLCLQKLNEKEEYDKKKIEQLVQDMVQKKLITTVEQQSIEIAKIEKFLQSTIWQEMRQAKRVYREQPFYTTINVSEAYEIEIEDTILVQGIIDAYYVDTNDSITLVDYKTDVLKDAKELIKKYETQLRLYQKALEKIENKKVEKVYLYSTYLGIAIKL